MKFNVSGLYLWVLTFPLEDCSEFGNFVIILTYAYEPFKYQHRNCEFLINL